MSDETTIGRKATLSGVVPTADSDQLEPGMVVNDYVVLGILSSGGFGAVYRVEHRPTGAERALKALHAELAATSEILVRFEREARAMGLIQHPNIVPIHDVGKLPDGRPYYVMELLRGVDLENHIEAQGRLLPTEIRTILDPLCEALAAAHEKGIVHRDIKPSNVFLHEDADGKRRVLLLDFGVAKLKEPGGPELTTSRHMIGTPSAMAPEQISGGTIDARTDVYALGALLFRMLTGAQPFPEEDGAMLQYMHLHGRRPRPSSRVNVSAAIDEVVVRAMSTDPSHRYAGALEFATAFREAMDASSGQPADTQSAMAFGIYVDVRADPESLEDPDDELLDDLDGILPNVTLKMIAHGFSLALEAGNSCLYSKTLAPHLEADGDTRDACIKAARVIARHLDERPKRDPRIHVNVCVHVDTAIIGGNKVRGGDLMRLAWVPQVNLEGVVGTSVAFEGLPLSTEAYPGTDLVRLLD